MSVQHFRLPFHDSVYCNEYWLNSQLQANKLRAHENENAGLFYPCSLIRTSACLEEFGLGHKSHKSHCISQDSHCTGATGNNTEIPRHTEDALKRFSTVTCITVWSPQGQNRSRNTVMVMLRMSGAKWLK